MSEISSNRWDKGSGVFFRINLRAEDGDSRFDTEENDSRPLIFTRSLSTTHAESLKSLMTLNFQRFEDVSLMAV